MRFLVDALGSLGILGRRRASVCLRHITYYFLPMELVRRGAAWTLLGLRKLPSWHPPVLSPVKRMVVAWKTHGHPHLISSYHPFHTQQLTSPLERRPFYLRAPFHRRQIGRPGTDRSLRRASPEQLRLRALHPPLL
jgi:hypothetical protein